MGKVNVVIVDATGNKEQKVGLPDDIKCGIIMVKLVEKIKLPSVGPDGNPISYKFIHKVTGRQLLEAQTLGEAGIKDGDVLRLQPEITAGSICSKCGAPLDEGQAFCPNCGQKNDAFVYPNTSDAIRQFNQNISTKKNKSLPIIIVAAVIAIIIAVAAYKGISAAQAEKMHNSLMSGNWWSYNDDTKLYLDFSEDEIEYSGRFGILGLKTIATLPYEVVDKDTIKIYGKEINVEFAENGESVVFRPSFVNGDSSSLWLK